MRTFNLRLILWLAGIFVVAAVSIHFVHSYQVRKNSGAYLEMARNSKDILEEMITKQEGTQKQCEDAAKQTIIFYQRYLGLQPNDDLDVRIEYATFLLKDLGDGQSAYAQNERILRATIEDDPELLAKQEEVRQTQIDLAGHYKQFADGIYHINELLKTRPGDAKWLERRGLYQLQLEAKAANNEAARESFLLAIDSQPDYLPAYARLAAVERERFENRGAGLEVIERMVAANPNNPQSYIYRAQFLASDTELDRQARQIQREVIKDAIADCEKALELESENVSAMHQLSLYLQKSGALMDDAKEQAAAYDRALTLLKKVIVSEPNLPQLYNQWANLEILSAGEADNSTARRDAAIHAIREGVKAVIDPVQNFDLRWRLADLLMSDKSNQEEVDELTQQLKNEQPESPLVAFLEARKLIAQEQWKAAANLLEAQRDGVSELVRRVDMMLAECYAQLGDQDLRLKVAQRAANRDLSDVNARIILADALASRNRLSEAIEQYEEITRLQPSSLEIRKRYASLLLSAAYRKSPEKRDWVSVDNAINAVVSIINARKLPDDPWVPMMQAEVLMSKQQSAEAEKLLEQAREKAPNELKFWTALVELALQQGNKEKAEQRYGELEAQFGDTLDVRLVRGRVLAKQEGKEAVAKLSELTKDLDKFPEAERLQFYWQLASICLTVGAFDEGLQYGQEAAKLMPNNLRLRLFMLNIARSSSNVTAAEQLAAEIEKIEGGGAVSTYAQAVVDVTRFTAAVTAAAKADQAASETEGTDDETANTEGPLTKKVRADNAALLVAAQDKLSQAAEVREGWDDIPVLQGVIAGYQGQQDVANGYFRDAIDLGNRNPAVAIQVVRSLAREASSSGENSQEKWFEADAIIRKLQDQRSSLTPDMGRLASEINYYAQEYGRALDLARPLAKTGETRDQKWVGLVAMANGNYDEAQASFEAATQLAPEDPEAWIYLVRCLQQAGNTDAANAVMNDALTKVKPESRTSLHADCLRLMERVDEALEIHRKAIASTDPSPGILQSAAEFFASEPKAYEDALPILERFVSGDLAGPDESAATKQWARRDLARILGSRGYKSLCRGIELLDQNLAENPDSLVDKQMRVKLLANFGATKLQLEKAKSDLVDLAKTPMRLDAETRFLLAKQNLAQGDWQKYRDEMTALLKASTDSPRKPAYVRNYVEALLQYGETGMAEGIASTFRRDASDELDATLLLARTLVAGTRPRAEEALSIVQEAVNNPTVKPESKPDKMEIAAASLQGIAEQLKQRVESLRTSVEGNDGKSKAVGPESEQLAQRIEKQIPPIETAIDGYYEAIVKEDPARELVVVPRMVKRQESQAAFELVEKNWETTTPDRLAMACGALLGSGNLNTADREAIENVLLEAVKKYDGTDDESMLNRVLMLNRTLAAHYVSRNMYDQAIQQYQKIVERSENDVITLNNLAMLMAANGEDLPLALEYINKALDLIGPQSMILDSQAMVLLASDKPNEALAAMQQVVAEKPDGITAKTSPPNAKRWGGYYFHLALAYQANGNKTKAAEAMKQAAELGFGEEDVFKPELGKYLELVGSK